MLAVKNQVHIKATQKKRFRTISILLETSIIIEARGAGIKSLSFPVYVLNCGEIFAAMLDRIKWPHNLS